MRGCWLRKKAIISGVQGRKWTAYMIVCLIIRRRVNDERWKRIKRVMSLEMRQVEDMCTLDLTVHMVLIE